MAGTAQELAAAKAGAERAEIVARRLAYERDPVGFCARFAEEEAVEEGEGAAVEAQAARAHDGELGEPGRIPIGTDFALRLVARSGAAVESVE